MWCLTCGFSPSEDCVSVEDADDEHMAHDGCHYPAWIFEGTELVVQEVED